MSTTILIATATVCGAVMIGTAAFAAPPSKSPAPSSLNTARMFAKIKETSGGAGEVPKADIEPTKGTLTTAKIDTALGQKGDLSNGVYKVTVGRTTRMHGHEVGKTMGVNTWAAFAGSDDRAVVDGDFAMLETELQPVLKALRHAGINIVAIHSHMAGEQPRILFLHYWGIGPAESLARAVRTALDLTKGGK